MRKPYYHEMHMCEKLLLSRVQGNDFSRWVRKWSRATRSFRNRVFLLIFVYIIAGRQSHTNVLIWVGAGLPRRYLVCAYQLPRFCLLKNDNSYRNYICESNKDAGPAGWRFSVRACERKIYKQKMEVFEWKKIMMLFGGHQHTDLSYNNHSSEAIEW